MIFFHESKSIGIKIDLDAKMRKRNAPLRATFTISN